MNDEHSKSIKTNCKLNIGLNMTDKITGKMSAEGADKASMELRRGVSFMFRCLGIGLIFLLLCIGISLIKWW